MRTALAVFFLFEDIRSIFFLKRRAEMKTIQVEMINFRSTTDYMNVI